MSERGPPDGGSRTSPDGGLPSRLTQQSTSPLTDERRISVDASSHRMSRTSSDVGDGDDMELFAFLQQHDLGKYADVLRVDGVHKVAHLRDVIEEECVQQWGMSKVEARRLVRVYEKWKKQHRKTIPQKLVRMLGGSGSVSTGVATSGSPVPTLSSASGHAGGGVRNQPQAGGAGDTQQAPSITASVCVVQPHELKITRMLGKGSFGTVNEAVWTLPDGSKLVVAVKSLDAGKDKQLAVRFIKEANILHQVSDHPRIIRLLGIGIDSLMMVTELAPGGSLLTRLRQRPMPISVLQLCTFAYQVAEAMVYLEQKGLVHRDLAARNVLLMDSKTCKISDFGLSRMAASDLTTVNRTYSSMVPIAWTAPEAVTQNRFSHKSDVWSYAVTVWEMFSQGEHPYRGKPMFEIISMIRPPNNYRLPRPRLCSPQTYSILNSCWHEDPDRRPNFLLLKDLISASRLRTAKVISNHKPGRGCDDELPLVRGEIVTIIDSSDPEAFFGQNSSLKTGSFPCGRVQILAQDVPGTGSNGSAAASAHGLAAAAAAAGAARGQPVMRGTAVAGNPVIRSDSVVYDDVMVDPGRRLNVNAELNSVGDILDLSSPVRSPPEATEPQDSYVNMASQGPTSPPLPEADYANAELAAAHFASGEAANSARTMNRQPASPYLKPKEVAARLNAALMSANAVVNEDATTSSASGAVAASSSSTDVVADTGYAALSSVGVKPEKASASSQPPAVAPFSSSNKVPVVGSSSSASSTSVTSPPKYQNPVTSSAGPPRPPAPGPRPAARRKPAPSSDPPTGPTPTAQSAIDRLLMGGGEVDNLPPPLLSGGGPLPPPLSAGPPVSSTCSSAPHCDEEDKYITMGGVRHCAIGASSFSATNPFVKDAANAQSALPLGTDSPAAMKLAEARLEARDSGAGGGGMTAPATLPIGSSEPDRYGALRGVSSPQRSSFSALGMTTYATIPQASDLSSENSNQISAFNGVQPAPQQQPIDFSSFFDNQLSGNGAAAASHSEAVTNPMTHQTHETPPLSQSPHPPMQQLASARPVASKRGPSLPYRPGTAISSGATHGEAGAAAEPFFLTGGGLAASATKRPSQGSVPPLNPSSHPLVPLPDRTRPAAPVPAVATSGAEGMYASPRPAWPLVRSAPTSSANPAVCMAGSPMSTMTVGKAFRSDNTPPSTSASSSASHTQPSSQPQPKPPAQQHQQLSREQEKVLGDLMAQMPGKTRAQCQQALATTQWNVKAALSYLCVRELLSLGLPGVQAGECLHALEVSHWKVDQAAEYLLQQQQ